MGLAVIALAGVLLAGCGSASPEQCLPAARVDLSAVDPNDDALLIRYPLDGAEEHPHAADFCEHRGSSGSMFHAAEDFWRPAGAEVYAMADGEVSFSGTMGGYGWLVIVDRPEMNVYSLYGHLSPSRWHVDPGPVDEGDLLGYLGDPWENGGSRDKPLVTHLHLGVRAGQRTDYPGRGEWRWMAGWIRLCPADLGWLQPSVVIAGQSTSQGGFVGPAGGFIERWWTELLMVGALLLGAGWWMVVGIRKRNPVPVLVAAVVLGGLAPYLTTRGFVLMAPVYVAAGLCLVVGILILVRRSSGDRPAQPLN
jgi:hypothetical protein